MEDVGDHGLVHPVASPQHAFGQICYRATVAELKGHRGGETARITEGNVPHAKKRRPVEVLLFGSEAYLSGAAKRGAGVQPTAGFNLGRDD